MKGLTLTMKEQTRLCIMNAVLERQWSVAEAAPLLGVSERHTWRLLAAYRKEGAAALAHRNRNRLPPNATPVAVQTQVIAVSPRSLQRGEPHTSDGASCGARRDSVVSFYVTAAPVGGRAAQPSASPTAAAPLSARAHASERHVGADRRQPPPLVGRTRTLVDPVLGCGRCHWHRTLRVVSGTGGYRGLFPVDEGHHTTPGHPTGTVQ